MAKNNSFLSNNIVKAIIYAIIGVLFCTMKGGLLDILMTVVGVLFIVYGIVDCVHKNYVNAVVYIVLGVLIIFGGWLFLELVLLVFGALLVVGGIFDLFKVIKTKKITNFLAPIATIVIGVLLFLSKWIGLLDWLFIILGVLFIVDAVLILFGKAK